MSLNVEFVRDIEKIPVRGVCDLDNPDNIGQSFSWVEATDAIRSVDFQRCVGIALLGIDGKGSSRKLAIHATPGAFSEFNPPEFQKVVANMKRSYEYVQSAFFGGVKRSRYENPYDLMLAKTVLMMRSMDVPMVIVPPRKSDGKIDMVWTDKVYLKVT